MSDTPVSPRANRLATPGWLDGRLVLGVLLVLVSVVVGARVLSAADRSTLVYAVNTDLAAGSVLVAEDLTPVRVRLFENAGEYVRVDENSLAGYVVRRGLGAGELLPRKALSDPGEEVDYREVTVPVETGHYPIEVGRDDQVDIWVTPDVRGAAAQPEAEPGTEEQDGAPPPTGDELQLSGAQLVLQGVTVLRTDNDGGSFSGSTTLPVVLQVRPDEVSAVVSAMSLGRIDLVRVPKEAQGSGRLEPAPGPG